ncbi:hypothetical protein Ddye_028755 [Dipteronia dyeriana]|uniref:Serine-threonine/tyrosine-protein kinase catalytic domain-containing protein n=1 Tax=Dipteronia dyeriana TaxID=168575 RepID=A0AAD9WL47_9ROSI|nr:hypothetical protein Ddye_028755 [Dipteronia dyeriana]
MVSEPSCPRISRFESPSLNKLCLVFCCPLELSENAFSTRLTEKSDVYSYGVVLLELLLRKMPVDPSFEEGMDIVSWTRKKLLENDDSIFFLDKEINYWESDDQRKAPTLLELALDCTEKVADTRPSMRDVVGFLMRLNDKI